jgi:hypothetical protein
VAVLAAGAAVFVLLQLAPSSAVQSDTIGTAGSELPDPLDTPATLYDLETVTGTLDPYELVGQHVDFHLHVADIAADNSFWVGTRDNRVLVVRSKGHTPLVKGQLVRISGTIEPLRPAARDQKIYLRADLVTPEP